MCNVQVHPPTKHNPFASQPQMTNEDAQHMNHDRCFYILSLLLTQPLRIEPLDANCDLLHAQQHSPQLSAQKNYTRTAQPCAPRNAKTPKAHATLMPTLMLKITCAKAFPTKPDGRPRRAGVRLRRCGRPAPPCVSSHSCHKGSLTSNTSVLAASQSASSLRSSWTSWCQTFDATTSILACTQTL